MRSAAPRPYPRLAEARVDARSSRSAKTGPHFHAWNVAATESDEFGLVRLYECSCGAARYDACA